MPMYSFIILKTSSTQENTHTYLILSLVKWIDSHGYILMPSLNRRNSYSNFYQQFEVILGSGITFTYLPIYFQNQNVVLTPTFPRLHSKV